MSKQCPLEKRLLITSCTRRKNPQPGGLPAWERYEGGCFPLLKQLQASHCFPSDVDLFILSAKYGLLLPEDRIEAYNQRMTRERAAALQPEVTCKIRASLARISYVQTFILLEEVYMFCLQKLDFPNLTYYESFSEDHLQCLKQWLLVETNREVVSLPSYTDSILEKRHISPGGD